MLNNNIKNPSGDWRLSMISMGSAFIANALPLKRVLKWTIANESYRGSTYIEICLDQVNALTRRVNSIFRRGFLLSFPFLLFHWLFRFPCSFFCDYYKHYKI